MVVYTAAWRRGDYVSVSNPQQRYWTVSIILSKPVGRSCDTCGSVTSMHVVKVKGGAYHSVKSRYVEHPKNQEYVVHEASWYTF